MILLAYEYVNETSMKEHWSNISPDFILPQNGTIIFCSAVVEHAGVRSQEGKGIHSIIVGVA
jgi:hypothetical protein